MNNDEAVRMQMIMAFGQGAGNMLASVAALQWLVTENSADIAKATATWEASRWAFLALVRTLGQVAATRAAMGGSWQIEVTHLQEALPAVRIACPC
jgi:hypothetical protein